MHVLRQNRGGTWNGGAGTESGDWNMGIWESDCHQCRITVVIPSLLYIAQKNEYRFHQKWAPELPIHLPLFIINDHCMNRDRSTN